MARRNGRSSWSPYPRLIAFVVIALVVAGFWWFSVDRTEQFRTEGVVGFGDAAFSGRQPALSPDGARLVYVDSEGAGGADLWLKTSGAAGSTRLTETAEDEHAPAISPDGKRLAFLRSGRSPDAPPCRLVVREGLRGAERVVGACAAAATASRIAWAPDGRSLYYADAPAGAPLRIRRLDLASGQAVDVTHPTAGPGDRDPAPAPDGRRLVFARYRSATTADLHLLDLKTNALVQVTDFAEPVSATWSTDGRLLLIGVDRAAAGALYASRHPERGRMSLVPWETSPTTALSAAGDTLAMAIDPRPSGIVVLSADGEQVIRVADIEHASPAYSLSGDLAFVTRAREGGRLWLMRPGQPPQAVDHLASAYGLSWAPGGHRMLYATAVTLASKSMTTEGRRSLFRPSGAAGPPNWDPENGFISVARRSEGWRIEHLEFTKGTGRRRSSFSHYKTPLSEPGWWAVRPGPDGLYAVKVRQHGIWRLPYGGGQPALVEPSFDGDAGIEARHDYAVSADTLYFVVRSGAGAQLMARPLHGGQARMVARLEGYGGGFAVSPVNGDVAYVRRYAPQPVIRLFRLVAD